MNEIYKQVLRSREDCCRLVGGGKVGIEKTMVVGREEEDRG